MSVTSISQHAPHVKRGDIVYIEREIEEPRGHEQLPGRPGIIVHNGHCTHMIVYLTTREDRVNDQGGLHVRINSAAKPSIALCDQIKTVDARRVGRLYGHITDEEDRQIAAAMCRALGIEQPTSRPEELQALPVAVQEVMAAEEKKERQQPLQKLLEAEAKAQAWEKVALQLLRGGCHRCTSKLKSGIWTGCLKAWLSLPAVETARPAWSVS